ATYVPGVRNTDGSCLTNGEVITITASDAPELIVDEVMDATDCETENGSISLQASGGNGEYEYRLSTTDWQDSPLFEGLGAGTVIASVRSGGCETFSEEITIVAPDAPVLSIAEVFNASDCDSDNGAIILSVEGNDDYEFSLDGIDWQETPFFVQLRIGDYTPIVRTLDGNCEVSLAPVEITADNTPQLSVQAVEDASDCGAADGSITLLGIGTTGDLEYQLDGLNWQQDQTFVNLQPGIYFPITRYTDGSCETVGEPIEIFEPTSPVLASTAINDATTCDGTDGSLFITATGGSDVYQYSIDGENWQDSPAFISLGAGEVTPYIRNADGSCVITGETQQISAPEGPQIEVLATVDVSDCGSENGAIILSGSGGTGPYEFSLDDGEWGGPNIVQLPQGTYEPRIRFAD
ncbi:MAG: SprB repeat-containing protein, partial [Bacteroidota bacterium]